MDTDIREAIKEAHEYFVFTNDREYMGNPDKAKEFYEDYLANLREYVKIKDGSHNPKTINEVVSILTGYSQEEEGCGGMPVDEAMERIKSTYNSYKPGSDLVESEGV